jgi:hypothetical protein
LEEYILTIFMAEEKAEQSKSVSPIQPPVMRELKAIWEEEISWAFD